MLRRVRSDALERLARELFEAYGSGDLTTVRSLIAEDVTAYVTNAEAGVDRWRVGRASRHGCPTSRALVSQGKVAALWMVDAKPAYSDEFWS
jgi:hypothetical protein